MKQKLLITFERLHELVHYDPLTGLFTRRIAVGRNGAHKAGKTVGCFRHGYVAICLDWRKYEAQRLAWMYMTGSWPNGDVDHRDTNPSNNRWDNLRDIPHKHNIENRRSPNKQNRVGLLGVCFSTKRPGLFRAQISSDGKNRSLGTFETAEEAHAAYVAAKRLLHKGNTL